MEMSFFLDELQPFGARSVDKDSVAVTLPPGMREALHEGRAHGSPTEIRTIGS